jgi:hypothetical protein
VGHENYQGGFLISFGIPGAWGAVMSDRWSWPLLLIPGVLVSTLCRMEEQQLQKIPFPPFLLFEMA